MFFFWSKLLDVLVDPTAWALLLGVAAVLTRRRSIAAAALVVLWVFSTEAVADALGGAVEAGGRDTTRPGVVYDAVIVLGGVGDVVGHGAEARLELNPAADRLVRAFEVLRAGRARHAILSSGDLGAEPGTPGEAELMARHLTGWGVDPGRLIVESRSRNTRENALECARIVRERRFERVVVLTSAAHLPRALGSFRAAGIAADGLPVDFRAEDLGLAPARLLPRARALDKSADYLRELAGRAVYRAMGYAR